jgi:hypothetical protein
MSDQEPDKQQKFLQRLLQRLTRELRELSERELRGLPELLQTLEHLALVSLRERPEWRAGLERELRETLEQLGGVTLREQLEGLEGIEGLALREELEGRILHIIDILRKPDMQGEQPPERESTAPISLYFDLDNFSSTDIANIIGLLSELYADVGGDGLVIDDVTLLEFQPAIVPVEM